MGFVEEWQQKTNPLNPILVMSKWVLCNLSSSCGLMYCYVMSIVM
jgi:hypothetical protein